MVRDDGKLDALREGSCLLARPCNRQKFKFDHRVPLFSACEVPGTCLDGLPVAVRLLLLQNEPETIQSRRIGVEPRLPSVVVEGECCWRRQKLLGLLESFVHFLGPNPVVGFLQQRVHRPGQF